MNIRRTILVIAGLAVLVTAILCISYFINFRNAYEMASRMNKNTNDTLQSSDTLRLINISNRQQEVMKIDSSKTYLINIFATWCVPCIKELPYISRLYESHRNSSVFLIISDEDTIRLNRFFAPRNNTLPVYQTTSKLPGFLFSMTIPHTVVIKKGKVAYTISEEIKETDYNIIDSLLR
jgi:thiol-disulfide isomerase/thioredoxin